MLTLHWADCETLLLNTFTTNCKKWVYKNFVCLVISRPQTAWLAVARHKQLFVVVEPIPSHLFICQSDCVCVRVHAFSVREKWHAFFFLIWDILHTTQLYIEMDRITIAQTVLVGLDPHGACQCDNFKNANYGTTPSYIHNWSVPLCTELFH